jgi:hypothetical protein
VPADCGLNKGRRDQICSRLAGAWKRANSPLQKTATVNLIIDKTIMKKIICFTDYNSFCLVFVCNAAAQDSKLTAAPLTLPRQWPTYPNTVKILNPNPSAPVMHRQQKNSSQKKWTLIAIVFLMAMKEMRRARHQNRDAANAAVQEFNDFANSLMPQNKQSFILHCFAAASRGFFFCCVASMYTKLVMNDTGR